MDVIEGSLPFEVETPYLLRKSSRADAPVLLALHGQGMNAERFLHILRDFPEEDAHLLVPQGPYPFEIRRPEGIQLGYSWYMYRGDQAEFRKYLRQGQEYLLRVANQVEAVHGVSTKTMTILGFSQGGYLAGCAALEQPERFPYLIVSSARIKTEIFQLEERRFPEALVIHGTNDPSTTWERAEENVEALRSAGASVDVILHEEGHRLPRSVVDSAATWMREVRHGSS